MSKQALWFVSSGLFALCSLFTACSPDTAGETCTENSDCFTNERCIDQTCQVVNGDVAGDVDFPSDTGSGDSSETDMGVDTGTTLDTSVEDSTLADLGSDSADGSDTGNAADTQQIDSDGPDIATDVATDVLDMPDVPLGSAPQTLAYWRLDGIAAEESMCLEQVMGLVTGLEGVFGDAQGALTFDGSTYIETEYTPDFGGEASFSLLAWFKTENADLAALLGTDQTDGAAFVLELSSAGIEFRLSDGSGNQITPGLDTPGGEEGAAALTDGSWHHVAVVRDVSVDQVFFYLDGALVGEAEGDPTQGSITTGRTLYLGGRNHLDGPQDLFGGSLDDVVILDGALSGRWVAHYYTSSGPWLERSTTCTPGKDPVSLPFFADFEEDDIGCVPSPWDLTGAEHGTVGVDPDGCNRVLGLHDSAADGGEPGGIMRFSPTEDDMIVELDLIVHDVAPERLTRIVTTIFATSSATAGFGVSDDTFLYYDGGAAQWGDAIEKDRWYHFRAEFDRLTDTYDVYLDGELLGAGAEFGSGTPDTLSSFGLNTSNNAAIDNIVIRAANGSSVGGECEYDLDCRGEAGLECIGGGCFERELLINGDFEDGYNDWELISGVCDPLPVEEVTAHGEGHDTAFRMETSPAYNCWFHYAQVVDVSAYDLTQLEFDWSWQVASMEGQYSFASVTLHFFEADNGTAIASWQMMVHGTSDIYGCLERDNCVDLTDGYELGTWTSHTLDFSDVVLPEGAVVDRVRVQLTSYDNADDGADVYFDDLSLHLPLD